MPFRIQAFDMSKVKPYATYLIIGKRRTGKTVLLLDLLYNTRKHYDVGIFLTKTKSTAKIMRKIMPSGLVYEHGYDSSAVQKLVALGNMHGVDSSKPRNFYMITDDLAYNPRMFKATEQLELAANGRHLKTASIHSTQNAMVPLETRNNTDYVFAFAETAKDNLDRLYKYFFSNFDSFAEFRKVFTECTQKYGCMVIDRTGSTTDPEALFRFYRANPNLPPFKLCKPLFWKLNELAERRLRRRQAAQGSSTKVII